MVSRGGGWGRAGGPCVLVVSGAAWGAWGLPIMMSAFESCRPATGFIPVIAARLDMLGVPVTLEMGGTKLYGSAIDPQLYPEAARTTGRCDRRLTELESNWDQELYVI